MAPPSIRVLAIAAAVAVLAAVAAAAASAARDPPHEELHVADGVKLVVSADSSYYVQVRGERWMESAPLEFHANAKRYAVGGDAAEPLTVGKMSVQRGLSNGTFGSYTRVAAHLQAGDGFRVQVAWEVYPEPLGAIEYPGGMIVYETLYPDGALHTSLRNPFATISSFPAFLADSASSQFANLEYLTYQKLWDNGTRSRGLDRYLGGLEGGVPLVQWSGAEETVSTVSVLSPLDNFAVNYLTPRAFGSAGRGLSCGLTGVMKDVPEGFAHRTVQYFGNAGVTTAMKQWGSVLLAAGKKRPVERDITRDYLGYWTDNGAYYYYKTLDEDPSANYEDTIIAVAAYHQRQRVPVAYYQLDSWWYYKASEGDGNCTLFHCGGGVTDWEARPDIFPNGMQYVHDKINKPLALHNRYWAKENVYQDEYAFFTGVRESLPQDERFFPALMANASAWGVQLYEQDWLVRQYSQMAEAQNNVYTTRTWLHEMAAAAAQHRMTVQYCMPLPQIELLSTELSAVTQIRVSDDYLHGHNQWNIGKTSLLAWALGLAPFKDTFWSTSTQPDNSYGATEPNPRLEAIVSALSNGPVAFGDRIGFSNLTLLRGTCMADGLLLRNDKPATPIDRCFGNKPPAGEVWSTFSTFGKGNRYALLLSISVTEQYQVLPQDLRLDAHGEYVAWQYDDTNYVSLAPFSSATPLTIAATLPGEVNGKQHWQLTRVSPLLGGRWAVLGEPDKIVSVSASRFSHIAFSAADLSLTISWAGAPGEPVTVAIADMQTGSVSEHACTVSSFGTAVLACAQRSGVISCSCQ